MSLAVVPILMLPPESRGANVDDSGCAHEATAASCAQRGRKRRSRPPTQRVERRAEAAYTGPAAGAEVEGRGAYVCAAGNPSIGCVSFASEPGEAFVSVEIADLDGMPVAATISQPGRDDAVKICGRTPEPIPIASGVEVFIRVDAVAAACRGVATSGVVTAVFSNVP